MKKFFTLGSVLILLTLVASNYDAMAQDLLNCATGVVVNNTTGTIVIKSNSKWRNDAPIGNTTNDGLIEVTAGGTFTDYAGTATTGNALGSTSAMRIPGNVLWSGTAAQSVQDRYYTNLATSNAGTKTFGPGLSYYVSGIYAPAGGDRNYSTSNFHYDGTAAQDIFGESGVAAAQNAYYNLFTDNAGVKTVQAASTANVMNNFTLNATNTGGVVINGIVDVAVSALQDAAAPIDINGATAILDLGSGASTLAGSVAVNAGGLLRTEDVGLATISGTTTVNNGTVNAQLGDLTITGTLALANLATAVIDVDASRTMTITGSFTNAFAAATNLVFDCTSTEIYDGAVAQTLVPTVTSNPYGNLTLRNSSKTFPGASEINMCANFALEDFDLSVPATSTLVMLTGTATATYENNAYEVIGAMKREIDANVGVMTYNNAQTTFQVTSNVGTLTDLTLRTAPGSTAINEYAPTTDVMRTIDFDYTQSGAGDWVGTFEFGYKPAEKPGTAGFYTLKLREEVGVTSEKVATGEAYARDSAAAAFNSVTLAGIRSTGGLLSSNVADNGQLFLRGGPSIIISIADGRWSNPATWDEGVEPLPSDSVIINGHQVHAGFIGSGGRDPFTGDETYPTTLARGINIQRTGNLGGGNPGLLAIGSGDPGNNMIFGQSSNTIIANNVVGVSYGTTVANQATFSSTAPAGVATLGGFLLFETTTFNAATFNNCGTLTNGGTISVGN